MTHTGGDDKRPLRDEIIGEVGKSGQIEHPLESAAVRLHASNRRRALHFNATVMADSAMDILLTVFIAHEHQLPLGRSALAMANTIPLARANSLIEELMQAGLIELANAVKPVKLSERGLRLMRTYLQSLPQAA